MQPTSDFPLQFHAKGKLHRSSRASAAPISSGTPTPWRGRVGAVLSLLALTTMVDAAPFRLISGTIDGGGEYSQGTRFSLEGTVGQPDAGVAQSARFQVEGGFWPTASNPAAPTELIFRNSFED
jgi:hypothetical protein